ncbi:MAG: hypothetical protein V3U45_02690 [bacterium]
MRPILLIPGVLILLMGLVFALQGAGFLPTDFMNGPAWIAIGSGVAIVGLGLAAFGLRTG